MSEDNLKNISVFFVYTIKVNVVWTPVFFEISSKISCWISRQTVPIWKNLRVNKWCCWAVEKLLRSGSIFLKEIALSNSSVFPIIQPKKRDLFSQCLRLLFRQPTTSMTNGARDWSLPMAVCMLRWWLFFFPESLDPYQWSPCPAGTNVSW